MSEFSITPEGEGTPQTSSNVDPVKYAQRMSEVRSPQSIALAVVAGLLASVVGAVIWGGITYASGRKLGLVAIGVGFIVGYAVKYFGNGSTIAFGVIGALFSVLGCVLGNILATVAFASLSKGVPLLSIALAFMSDPLLVVRILQDTFTGMDILFYGIAIYEGFRFSMADAPPPQSEVLGLQDHPPPPPAPAAPTPPSETAE